MALAQLIGTVLILIIALINLKFSINKNKKEKKLRDLIIITGSYTPELFIEHNEWEFVIGIKNEGNTNVFIWTVRLMTGGIEISQVVEKKIEPGNAIIVEIRIDKCFQDDLYNKVYVSVTNKLGRIWNKQISLKREKIPGYVNVLENKNYLKD